MAVASQPRQQQDACLPNGGPAAAGIAWQDLYGEFSTSATSIIMLA
jgi:hypothetical protein